MLALRLIERKRDGGRVETGEWRALTNAYASGHVPEIGFTTPRGERTPISMPR